MDTSSFFLGLRLPRPFISGRSLGFDLDTIKRLEDGGCAVPVIPSLVEEQLTLAGTSRSRQRDPGEHELTRTVRELTRTRKIPPAVKLFPFPTAFGRGARPIDEAGVAGLMLFNCFLPAAHFFDAWPRRAKGLGHTVGPKEPLS